MELWDQEPIDLVGPAFIDFDHDKAGRFRFIAVDGYMNCRYGDRDRRPVVDFTWEGHDECDPADGRGLGRPR